METFSWFSGFVLPYVNFFIFAGILYYFARNPARSFAENKKQEYKNLMEKALSTSKEVGLKLDLINSKLQKLDGEVKNLISEADAESENELRRLKDSTERLKKHIQDEAKRATDSEVLKAKIDLQNEILVEVKKNVEQTILSSLSEAQHQQLLLDQVGKLKK